MVSTVFGCVMFDAAAAAKCQQQRAAVVNTRVKKTNLQLA